MVWIMDSVQEIPSLVLLNRSISSAPVDVPPDEWASGKIQRVVSIGIGIPPAANNDATSWQYATFVSINLKGVIDVLTGLPSRVELHYDNALKSVNVLLWWQSVNAAEKVCVLAAMRATPEMHDIRSLWFFCLAART